MRQAMAGLLAGMLAVPAGAQAPAAGPGAQGPASLKILVIDGEGAINNIQLGTGREPVVEVRDESDRPVSGAKVTFSMPESGPGGTFFGASRNMTIATNEQGRATATGFRPNLYEGRFQIRVTAAAGDKSATAVISQSNSLPSGAVNRVSPGKKKFGAGKIVALVVAAAVAGIIGATRGGDEETVVTTPTPGTSITPGVIAVGAPR